MKHFGKFAAVCALGVALPAAPEPAAWALMIVGFGLVGGAMRRSAKSRKVVSV